MYSIENKAIVKDLAGPAAGAAGGQGGELLPTKVCCILFSSEAHTVIVSKSAYLPIVA